MPLFLCERCGCYENTALSGYWMRDRNPETFEKAETPKPALCSACDPEIGKWHNAFPQKSAAGMLIGDDGFLYHESERKHVHHTGFTGKVEVPVPPSRGSAKRP